MGGWNTRRSWRLGGTALVASLAVAGPAAGQNYLWQGLDLSVEGSPSFLTSMPRNVFAQDLNVTIPNLTLTARDRHIHPEFGGSLKAMVAWRFGEWDMGTSYRATFSGRNHERASVFVAPNLTNATLPAYPALINGLIPIAGLDAHSEASSLQNTVDIEIGRNMVMPWGELRLFGGLRYTNYDSLITTRFSNLGLAEFQVDRSSHYWGIGPRFGAGVTVPLAPRWWLNASASASVLFGERRTVEARSLLVGGVVIADRVTNGGGRTAFGFDGEVSLTHILGRGVYATLGYGVQSHIGINDTRRLDLLATGFSGSQVFTGTSAGSIVNHGPFIKIGWRPGMADPPASGPGPQNLPSGTIAVETRFFPLNPASREQKPHDYSFWGELEFGLDFADRSRVSLKPFFRYDTVDDKRTHWDLREAYWAKEFEHFRLRIGVARVFWGTLESVHLVDIINQVDLIEAPDVSSLTEYRLGQPMVHLSVQRAFGTFDFFYLPYARERTFPGSRGRLRSLVNIDTDSTLYESGLHQWYPSFAVRYSHSLRGLDFGAYYFHGTSRDPSFKVDVPFTLAFIGLPPPRAIPFYQIINQVGGDAVYTMGPWQFKFEGLVREGFNNRYESEETYVALGAGVEYTFKQTFNTGIDVGLLGEFLWDSRGRRATTPFEHDLFVGARVNFNDRNDTRALVGYIQDVRFSDKIIYVGASRRLWNNFRLDLQARFFLNPSHKQILHDLRRDHYIQLSLLYRF